MLMHVYCLIYLSQTLRYNNVMQSKFLSLQLNCLFCVIIFHPYFSITPLACMYCISIAIAIAQPGGGGLPPHSFKFTPDFGGLFM
jgi:hypothetical protein